MYIIISQSKNPPTFFPPTKNKNKRLFGRGFLGHFLGQPASENAHCEGGEAWVGHLQPTPHPRVLSWFSPGFPDFASARRGRICFLLSASFLSAGPSKNIKWEQMKHRNGDQFTEMCN